MKPLRTSIAAVCLTILAAAAHAKEVMTCGVGVLSVISVGADPTAAELTFNGCGAPLKQEKVPLSELYAKGWRLIQTIRGNSSYARHDIVLFVFER